MARLRDLMRDLMRDLRKDLRTDGAMEQWCGSIKYALVLFFMLFDVRAPQVTVFHTTIVTGRMLAATAAIGWML